jgi:hypothetical protein
MHASDAAALFVAPGNEDEDEDIEEDDIDGVGDGDDLDVDGLDSRGGSLVDEGDEDAILVSYLLFKGSILLIQLQWEATPPPIKRHAISLSPPPSTQPRRVASLSPLPSTQPCVASLSPPPSTQPRRLAPIRPIRQKATTIQHGKPIMVKKTAVDRFNDSHQEETRRLDLKRKMQHDKKMASYCLKKHKYNLQYGSTTPQTPDSPVALIQTKEDKQIEILRLQIRLAELTQENSASSSQMPHNPLDEVSTPSSGMSGLSQLTGYSHNSFVDDDYMTSKNHYHVSGGEASDVGVAWPETFNFAA